MMTWVPHLFRKETDHKIMEIPTNPNSYFRGSVLIFDVMQSLFRAKSYLHLTQAFRRAEFRAQKALPVEARKSIPIALD